MGDGCCKRSLVAMEHNVSLVRGTPLHQTTINFGRCHPGTVELLVRVFTVLENWKAMCLRSLIDQVDDYGSHFKRSSLPTDRVSPFRDRVLLYCEHSKLIPSKNSPSDCSLASNLSIEYIANQSKLWNADWCSCRD